MNVTQQLFEVDAVCPRCGEPPRIRATALQVEKWKGEAPGALVQTYQCAFEVYRGRKCNHIYPITARAFQRAREM